MTSFHVSRFTFHISYKLLYQMPFYLVVIVTILNLPGVLAYADVPISALIGAWLFDEGGGDIVKDASGNGNHMTIAKGAPEWIGGKFGKAMEFDGKVDYLAAPDSPSLNTINGQTMSIVAWVNGANLTVSPSYIISRPLVYTLEVRNNKLRFYLCIKDKNGTFVGISIEGDTNIETGKWAHLALVYDGKELRGYVNGELDIIHPIEAEGNIIILPNELRIGGDPGVLNDPRPPGYFAGSIDEVGLFRTMLTEDQIREILRKGLTGLSIEPKDKLATVWGTLKRGSMGVDEQKGRGAGNSSPIRINLRLNRDNDTGVGG